ncbi:MAG TPA: phytanoyl-CoA dioxygenase family protein [Alphaproteobacteria bacterium]|nr:phytanoyl-CoA dioxygenase family protein [Alphaproteobacteria bacterium]
MSATISRFSATASPDTIAGALSEAGAVIVDGVLDRGVLADFNAEIDGYLTHGDPGRQYMNKAVATFYGDKTRHVAGLSGKSSVFRRDILCREIFVAMCERVLRPSCATYQLNFADIIERGPGAQTQMLHRDDGIWPHMPRPCPDLEFASMVALGEFTAEMGATLIAPGSHRWDRSREATPDELVAAELDPGSAVFYLGSTIHAGGTNATQDKWRRGMHLSYCLGWLRTEDNNYLTAPLDIVRTLPPAQQAMLGYAIHDGIEVGGGFLGAVNWRDPLELIAEGKL